MAAASIPAPGTAATPVRITLSATPGNLREVQYASGTTELEVRPEGAAAYYCRTGTDEAAAGTDYGTLDADTWTTIRIHPGSGSIYIYGTNASQRVQVDPVGRI